ncbi:unnamed protein product [Closterium sp. NIES-64]|nr:unnamed protein product [Closterium sp. NIES-64]
MAEAYNKKGCDDEYDMKEECPRAARSVAFRSRVAAASVARRRCYDLGGVAAVISAAACAHQPDPPHFPPFLFNPFPPFPFVPSPPARAHTSVFPPPFSSPPPIVCSHGAASPLWSSDRLDHLEWRGSGPHREWQQGVAGVECDQQGERSGGGAGPIANGSRGWLVSSVTGRERECGREIVNVLDEGGKGEKGGKQLEEGEEKEEEGEKEEVGKTEEGEKEEEKGEGDKEGKEGDKAGEKEQEKEQEEEVTGGGEKEPEKEGQGGEGEKGEAGGEQGRVSPCELAEAVLRHAKATQQSATRWVWGSGCGAVGVGQWVWGSGCGAVGVGQWVWGSGCGAVGVGQWVWGSGCEAVGVGQWVWGSGSEAVGVGQWVWGSGCGAVGVGQWVWGSGCGKATT